jgi:hypothetical protein
VSGWPYVTLGEVLWLAVITLNADVEKQGKEGEKKRDVSLQTVLASLI